MRPGTRTALAWVFVVAVAALATQVLPWVTVRLVAATAAHSTPASATLVLVVQLLLWLVVLGAAVWLAARFMTSKGP